MTTAFTVVVEKDPESGWLVGEVVELPGCYTQTPDLPQLEAISGKPLLVTSKQKLRTNPFPFSLAPGGLR